MTDYRAVVRHVRYWRGKIHVWSTSYQFTGSGTTPDTAACTILKNKDSDLCYQSTGALGGGIHEVQFYRIGTSMPVASETFFDYTNPSAWVSYTSAGWGGHSATSVEFAAEIAALVEWPAGVSRTGKPVKFRKWYHAVPTSSSSEGATPDIASGVITTMQTAALALQTSLASGYGLALGNAGRLAGTTPICLSYYSNHQMPRGRRKKLTTISGGTGSFSVSKPVIVEPD